MKESSGFFMAFFFAGKLINYVKRIFFLEFKHSFEGIGCDFFKRMVE